MILRPITRPITRPIVDHPTATPVRTLEKFETLSGWTYASGAYSRIELAAGRGVLADDCLNFNTDLVGGTNASITKNVNIDLSAVDGFWLCYRVNHRQVGTGVGLTMYLAHAAELSSSNGRWVLANRPGSGAVSEQSTWIPKTAWGVLDGSPSFDNPVLSYRFRVDSSGTDTHDFDLLGITIERRRPTVVITHDDGTETAYSVAFTEGQSRGIPQTFYLIGSLINGAGYMTQAQALEIQAAGDCVGLHGALRWDEDTGRIATDVAALDALGLPYAHAAYPEGQIGAASAWKATVSALQAAGVVSGRLTGDATPFLPHRNDPFAMQAYSLNNSMTLAAAKAAVDAAIASGGTVVFYGHNYGATANATTWGTSDFTALLDYIVTKRAAGFVDTKSVDQLHFA